MKIVPTAIPDVVLIEPRVFPDDRGSFQEIWQRTRYAESGIDVDFVQDNLSRSVGGTLRGLHYQIRQPQGKLVQVLSGRIFDVAVDLRRSSPQFGKWVGVELDSESRRQIYIPPGFAHGFYVLSDTADVLYKCTDFYAPDCERTLIWNDPNVGIDWPLRGEPRLSAKDQLGVPLDQAEVFDGD